MRLLRETDGIDLQLFDVPTQFPGILAQPVDLGDIVGNEGFAGHDEAVLDDARDAKIAERQVLEHGPALRRVVLGIDLNALVHEGLDLRSQRGNKDRRRVLRGHQQRSEHDAAEHEDAFAGLISSGW